MREDRRRSRPSCPGFLLRFRCRPSLLDHPIPAEGLGLPHGRLTDSEEPDRDGVPAFRTHELRPGWVPSVPRGRRCSSRSEARSQPAPAALPRLVPSPRHDVPPCEALLHEASIKGLRSSPVRASPRPRPRGGTGGASAFPPELRTPPSPAAHVRGGDRPSSTDLELPLNSHPSISNPVVHSMRATSRRTANARCLANARAETRFYFLTGTTSVVP